MISPSMMTLSSRRKQCDATWRAPMNAYIVRGEKLRALSGHLEYKIAKASK
jgi:hypothetical protein